MAGATEARGGKEPRGVQLDKAAGCSRVHALPVHSHGEKPTCQRPQLLRRVQICRQFVFVFFCWVKVFLINFCLLADLLNLKGKLIVRE